MSQQRAIDQITNKNIKSQTQLSFTIGQVVDTNDPQQMGRLRVVCPAYGDRPETKIRSIPWALYVSPLAGMTNFGVRGHTNSSVYGPVAYGMWNIPKIGAYVLVGCVDGDKTNRFWIGCIYPQYLTHTAPHGRYLWNEESVPDNKRPEGPVDSYEIPIEPLYTSFTQQFTPFGNYYPENTPTEPRKNLEWRTRGTDNQVGALDGNFLDPNSDDYPGSEIADHSWDGFEYTTVTEEDGRQRVIRGTGYGVDQQEPEDVYPKTGGTNYDSLIYSWTTPGFHSVSMDDRDDNSRIRIRTTSGHQIIMDDTNERIYINTAGGETWIELDKAGNIDIYASRDISTHAKGDINFVADKTFRVQAKQGIHMTTDDEVRITAKGDAHVKSGGVLYLTSVGEMHQRSDGNMIHTAPRIDFNGPAATPANESFVASRIPEHEPWARVYSDPSKADQDQGNSFSPMPKDYTDPNIGRVDRDGNSLNRNNKWHR